MGRMRRNIVGERLRILRVQKGLSQTELSHQLNACGIPIENTVLCKMESGRRSISDYELFGIAQCLGISVGSFFEDEDIDTQFV